MTNDIRSKSATQLQACADALEDTIFTHLISGALLTRPPSVQQRFATSARLRWLRGKTHQWPEVQRPAFVLSLPESDGHDAIEAELKSSAWILLCMPKHVRTVTDAAARLEAEQTAAAAVLILSRSLRIRR